jgi:hypothetical protein
MLTNSWIIVDKASGKAVFETYNAATASAVNRNSYDVLTAYDYLVRLNRQIAAQR